MYKTSTQPKNESYRPKPMWSLETGKMVCDCGHLGKGFLKEMTLGTYATYPFALSFLVTKEGRF